MAATKPTLRTPFCVQRVQDGNIGRMIFKYGIGAIAAALMGLSSTPTLANDAPATGTITAAQITSAVKAGDTATTGDEEFTELFASWKALEAGTPAAGAFAPRAKVSVPSVMPLTAARMSSSFGMRTHPVLGGRRNHAGIDLASPTGTPVYATADGLVSKAEAFSSYGNYIAIEHGGEMQTRYAHLSGYAVSAGQRVTKGQLIGYVGSTGRSTGPHLHYEVRVSGEAVDPRPYMLAELEVTSTGGMGGPE
jgi:murein DD-endopeptidase MepM/ murein hydrolase activator NlpD